MSTVFYKHYFFMRVVPLCIFFGIASLACMEHKQEKIVIPKMGHSFTEHVTKLSNIRLLIELETRSSRIHQSQFGFCDHDGERVCVSRWKLHETTSAESSLVNRIFIRDLVMWKLSSSNTQLEKKISCNGSMITALAFAPKSRWYAVGRADGTIELYTKQATYITEWQAYKSVCNSSVLSLACNDDSSELIAISYDGLLKRCAVSPDGRIFMPLPIDSFQEGIACAVAYAHTSKNFIVGLNNGLLIMCNREQTEQANSFYAIARSQYRPDLIALSRSDKLLASFSKLRKLLCIWDVARGICLCTKQLAEMYTSLLFLPDGKRLRLCSANEVYDLHLLDLLA